MMPHRCTISFFVLVLSITAIAVYASDSDSGASFAICADAPIQVQDLSYYCDSPYTYYYGNGAHRNSATCDFGDKVTVSMQFYVAEAIESNIYMQLSAYTDTNKQLYSAGGLDLCNDYVGMACNDVGFYSFSTKIQFAYIDGDEMQFVPSFEISFTDGMNGAFDLGGVNIECDTDESSYSDWQNARANHTKLNELPAETIIQAYGILTMTCVSLVILGIVLWIQTKDNVDYARIGSNRSKLLDPSEALS